MKDTISQADFPILTKEIPPPTAKKADRDNDIRIAGYAIDIPSVHRTTIEVLSPNGICTTICASAGVGGHKQPKIVLYDNEQ